MNILFLCHQFMPEYIGGTELYTLGLARRAQQAGHRVLVAHYAESPSGDPNHFQLEYGDYQKVPTAQIYFNLSLAGHPLQAEYLNPELTPFFQELYRTFQPDLVHHTHNMKVSGSALRFFSQQGIPNILTMPDFWHICPRHTLIKWDGTLCRGPRSPYYCAKCLHHTHGFLPAKIMSWPEPVKALYFHLHDHLPVWPAAPHLKSDARAMRRRKDTLLETALLADAILVLSEFQRSLMVANGYPADRLTLTRHGLETAGLTPKESSTPPTPPLRLTYIGSITPHKGVHILLDAFAKTRNQQLSLTIYGSFADQTPYQEEIRQSAEKLDHCRLGGTFPFDETGTILQQTDVLVMPAQWYENEPLVVKAALYCRIPVMTTRIGSLPGMVDHEKNGWLLPHNDTEAWIRIFDRLTPGYLQQFSESTYPITTMDDYFTDIHQLYQQLTNAQANPLPG